jgi:protein-disulfide isomerase-like protein with CxxC motif
MKDNINRVEKFNIQGFPTILLIDKSDNKDKMVKAFEDARTYTNLEKFIINNI